MYNYYESYVAYLFPMYDINIEMDVYFLDQQSWLTRTWGAVDLS